MTAADAAAAAAAAAVVGGGFFQGGSLTVDRLSTSEFCVSCRLDDMIESNEIFCF